MARTAFVLSALLGLIPVSSPAQRLGGGGEAHPALETNRASLKTWQAMRFGMFIHIGLCPLWHKGAGGKAWLFVDEITIE